MAIMRIISRLILHDSSHSSLSRRLSTAAAAAAAQPESPNALFKKVVEASSKNGSVVDVMNEYFGGGEIVRRADFFNLAAYFRSRRNFRAALQLYEWLDCSNLQRTTADEAVRIHLLGKIEGSASAEKYFNGLHEKSKQTCAALLSCYCKNSVLDKALAIFEKMNESNYTWTGDYNNVITLYHNLQQPEKVVSLVEEMEERNIAPCTYTYNMLINSHIALKNLDAIDGVLEKMKIANVKCNTYTYRKLSSAYLNAGLHDKAATFLELMERRKSNKGNAKVVCSIRIRFYSTRNDPAGVNRAWEDLKSDVEKPDNYSYLSMLRALSKLGDRENLEKILKEWEEGCTLYDYRLPNVVLEYYLSRDMIEEATLLYKRLVDGSSDRGSEPSIRTLELFMILCLKNCEVDLAMEYLEKALGKVNPRKMWHPRHAAVEEFIKYFKEKGDRERGGKFVEIMKRKNVALSKSLVSYMEATERG